LLKIFHASHELFHTEGFGESLATQTLVLFVIQAERPAARRAAGPADRSPQRRSW